ncbi:acetyl-coenzyme A transporter 1-like isoform X1 [Daktulosphaira vitifoliae]|uniref:acetyl-coenzyme A transporter 1-like isoform X1 n=1 Tax=Daktulosphaira vitifoliae TaxID=58002 RepID=UPI0021A9C3B3|nr:acetyl-coenzyme A transporter 1-like isoform X1 [Daktulosphaira vitifoliae]XP_050522846.1 acetyl-coenzyme A transporter 1-like isoform X1 [Daktulosphaira vitifoliae]XP_050522847.1 acetyl-coenzyme A transporter 1-like isoform X1 [Daktulosphaira vitifoliae]XP_050522848.1 acetyl-coenzyme A transporter 1-like isoform X1 [Daktulosphaira vitifoliae]
MSNNVQTHVEDSNLSKPNLKGDWNNIFLLILLYTLQGVELGFLLAMPIILQNQKNTTYEDQALFSISNWPFSMKLMWAPIVDSLYIKKFGRRKSWLLPVQTLLGTILLFSAYNINDWIYKDDRVHILILSATFFLTNLLAATQDVAVDGWALTLLKKENVGYASTCNSSGHSIGGFFGFVLTVLLNSERFCNSYLRSTPMKGGIVSLDSILYFWGFAFIIVTSLIGLLKREVSSLSAKDDTARLNVYQTYKMLFNIIKLPGIITLIFALLMFEIGFTATDNVTTLKLLDAGLPTENLMMITLAFYPAKILIPVIVSKYTSGPKPMSALLNVYPFRLSSGIFCGLLVYVTSKLIGKDENGIYERSIIYYAFLIVTIFIKELLAYYIFVATMGFFAKISDPRFGGTYMTMLNTVSNIGASWTATASLCMVDWLTFKSCSSDSKNNCSTEDLTKTYIIFSGL